MVKYLINEQYDVQEPEVAKSFSKGEKREDYADSWNNTGNIILMGLPGCGKIELGTLLKEKTGQELIVPAEVDEAVEALKGSGKIVVLEDVLVEDQNVQPLIHGAGKSFYLMADSNTLSQRVAERDGVEDREQLWRDLSARLAVMEPMFYGALHFILQAAKPTEEMAEDAMEKIAF
ncbi:hypothetical protein [Pseudodesulfovibrio sp. zrk46]|uniref:hypothetical protein n=1 Tax=Pseudodesulfovibrio sp. zrk46 TaxID=2725288 RepID=UPI001448EFB8|nr:hypothetical protein [Pseudodesulfovibrio sp. zrk46]QJB58115.1 hypothetical protein HFN16_17755 [Pseudodesulfovibrio sp. zrk46]